MLACLQLAPHRAMSACYCLRGLRVSGVAPMRYRSERSSQCMRAKRAMEGGMGRPTAAAAQNALMTIPACACGFSSRRA
jgi:hypothetical protein